MTIDYKILVGDPLSLEKKLQIQKIIDATFQEIDDIFNKWNPSSEISCLNGLPANTARLLSPQLANFLVQCDNLVCISEGRFDPTIEPLQKLWKKHLELGKIPSNQEIEALKPFIGWNTIHFANGVFLKDHAHTQLDFGGIAKGLCVDMLIERLHLAGLNSLYVEWGGEIRTLGFHPSHRPWRVYISHLDNIDPSQAIAHVDLVDCALATSGDYFQNWKIRTENGKERIFCHILNPLTLTPLEIKPGSAASASLKASDCLTADALAKVLMLFDDPADAKQWIGKLQEKNPEIVCWIAVRQSND